MGLFLKLLGFIDLVATLFLFTTSWWSIRAVLFVAIALAGKGVIFWSDPVSRFDIVIACYLAFSALLSIRFLSILFGIYLGLKALYSMV